MSIARSMSTDSLSSSINMPTEQALDPSNILYNDRQNYQIIFTNDSRFFDTSLHLFKSYCDLGYIKTDEKKKLKKQFFSSSSNALKPLSNGIQSRWRSKPTGFSSNHDINENVTGTLKPPFLRNYDYSNSYRSDPGSSKLKSTKVKRENSSLVPSYQRQVIPTKQPVAAAHDDDDDDDSDGPDIIVTRF